MGHWFDSLSGTEYVFLICAAAGAVGVLLRLISQIFGFAGGSLDVDADLDVAGHADTHHAGDGFKVISIHGLAAFFMMFGLVGFAIHRENQASVLVSIVFGIIAGAFSVWIIAKLFMAANKLQSVGNLDIKTAAGCPGVVYLQIPEGSTGRVVINVKGRQREMDAVHIGGGGIATGTPIVVVRTDEKIAVVDYAQSGN